MQTDIEIFCAILTLCGIPHVIEYDFSRHHPKPFWVVPWNTEDRGVPSWQFRVAADGRFMFLKIGDKCVVRDESVAAVEN